MNRLRRQLTLSRVGYYSVRESCDFFEEYMGIHHSTQKFFVLVEEKSIVCCFNALYHSDYLSFVTKEYMLKDCLVNIRLPSDEHDNCAFYLEK